MARKFNVFSELDKQFKDNKSRRLKAERGTVTPEEIKNIVSREVNAASTKNQMMNYFDSIAASGERTETMLVELRDVLDAGLARIDEAAQRNDSNEKLEQIDASVRKVLELSQDIEKLGESFKKVESVKDSINEIDKSVRKVMSVTDSLQGIDETVRKVSDMGGSIEQVDESFKRFAIMQESLETSLHKDNLISYRNLKEAIDAVSEKAEAREKRLRNGIITAIVINAMTFVLAVIMILINLNIL